uniref:Uncharacterized protein n=1 Tax=Parascaris equorum TaxID=6256 RepID=A0A914RLT0_PAREQ
MAQLVRGVYLGRYDPTIEDRFRKQIEVDGRLAALEILDTAGTVGFLISLTHHKIQTSKALDSSAATSYCAEQFAAMRDLYMKHGDGFVIVYSVTDARSLAETTNIFQNLVRTRRQYHVRDEALLTRLSTLESGSSLSAYNNQHYC